VSNLEDDMAILVEASHREAAADLLNSSFELRHRILVQRLGWQLPSGQAPRETDAFDAGHTCHLISRTHDGRVRGTMRLTPSLAPNVTCDVLQSQIPIPFPRAAHIVECSRLCVDLDMPSSERFAARADLFLSQLEMCERFGWTHTIGVLLQSVLQYFIRAGLAVDLLSPPLRFPDSTETSVAFILESGPEALATGRAVLRMNSALQDPARDPSLLRTASLAHVA
jgi:N-acyl-L-homoserine lactone synthetase